MDVSDRRMQVQLTRKFCLRQNLSPRATGFVDPEGLGKSTCRKQKSPLIFYIRAIFAVAGFISALRPPGRMASEVLFQNAQMARGSGMTSLLKS